MTSVYNKGRQAGKLGLFIKFSSKRNSSWLNLFILSIKKKLERYTINNGKFFFVALVSNDDGVACLNYDLLTPCRLQFPSFLWGNIVKIFGLLMFISMSLPVSGCSAAWQRTSCNSFKNNDLKKWSL